jgi:Co/Zn/Cd efflux system component
MSYKKLTSNSSRTPTTTATAMTSPTTSSEQLEVPFWNHYLNQNHMIIDHHYDENSINEFNESNEIIQARNRGGLCSTSNLRALWGLFLLNTTFAIAQMIAANIANSLTMFSDSGSMLVDSVSYAISLWMERYKVKYGKQKSKLCEVYVSILSVLLLVIVTIVAVVDASKRLCCYDDMNDKVDGRIVFGFSLANLFVDFFMCGNFCYQLRHRRRKTISESIQYETKEELNMVAAFVHLFADTLRTITGLVAGSLESYAKTFRDTIIIDSIATYVVCSAILLAAGFVLYEGCQQYKQYKQDQQIYNENSLIALTQLNHSSINHERDNDLSLARENIRSFNDRIELSLISNETTSLTRG